MTPQRLSSVADFDDGCRKGLAGDRLLEQVTGGREVPTG
jgi:hypothetical protein